MDDFNFILLYYVSGIDVVDRGCCGTGNLEVAVLCNPSTPTCLNSSSYLFWDSYHPTETGYMILVRRVLDENIINIHKLF